MRRTERPFVADERAALDSALEYQRETLLWKCGGLTAQQLTLRPLAASKLSLLGIARHLADCERWWFRRHFAGQEGLTGYLFFTEENLEGDFDDGTPESAAGDLEVYRAEVAAARAAVRGRPLDDTFRRPHGEVADLRWLYFHLIEEYARHNGHADLLREHIDGRTGE